MEKFYCKQLMPQLSSTIAAFNTKILKVTTTIIYTIVFQIVSISTLI